MGKKCKKYNPVMAFRCWSRKSFAVFNSLGKVIKICTLCIVYNIISLPGNAQSKSGSDSIQIKTIEPGEVEVTAERTPVEAQIPSRVVLVISKSEIARAPVQNLNDLLRFVAGVDIRQRGPLGAQADISIRGGTFDQTLILLNGVNITDPQTGHHNLNLPVDPESIERIEILQGPANGIIGPGAFSGAINIVTGNSGPGHIRTSLMYGQYGLFKTSAGISNTTGRFSQFLSISKASSDGYIKNTDFSIANIFYQAKYIFKNSTFGFQTGYSNKSFGANSFYSLKYPNQFEATKTEFASLKYENDGIINFKTVFYVRRNLDLFELKRNNDSIPFNHHLTNVTGIDVNASMTNRFGITSLGINLRDEFIKSNVLGIKLNVPVAIKGFDNTFYTRYYNRMNTGFYAGHVFTWNMLMVTANLTAQHNQEIKGFGIYPGLDVSWRINKFRLFSSANKTLRMPVFTDMFYKSPVQRGNRDLKPEEAYTIEAGLKYNDSFLRGNLSMFRRWGYNMIDWVKDPSPDSLIWRSMNYTRINFSGMECSLAFTPSKTSPFERIQTLRLSYSLLRADKTSNGLLSKYALDYLSGQITAAIDIRIAWKLFVSDRLTYHDRNGVYQDIKGQVLSYKPYWLSDMKLYWKASGYSLYTEASNIFNAEYYDFGGIIQPGAWFRGGIIVDLDYKKNN